MYDYLVTTSVGHWNVLKLVVIYEEGQSCWNIITGKIPQVKIFDLFSRNSNIEKLIIEVALCDIVRSLGLWNKSIGKSTGKGRPDFSFKS